MSLIISEHIQVRLTEEARRQGLSVDALLDKLINERAGAPVKPKPGTPELPVWHLGASGFFRRRDIYNDVP